LRESHVLKLHQLAIEGIYPCGAQYRDARHSVWIDGSEHELPDVAAVPALTRDAVDWINQEKGGRSALELAAFSLWRMNWIHPFKGGNGRTARAVAYLIVCMGNGKMLPGTPSMPAIVCDERDEYVRVLRICDKNALARPADPDFSEMVNFLERALTKQLAAAILRLKQGGAANVGA
jgi:fido (protein-threonine AMPylation protein)